MLRGAKDWEGSGEYVLCFTHTLCKARARFSRVECWYYDAGQQAYDVNSGPVPEQGARVGLHQICWLTNDTELVSDSKKFSRTLRQLFPRSSIHYITPTRL